MRVAEFMDNQPVGPVSYSARRHYVRESDSAALRAGKGRGGGRNGAEGGGFCGQSAGGTGVLFRSPAL